MSVYKDASGAWRYRCTVTLRDGSTERISGTPSAANTKLAAREAEDAHRERAVNPAAPAAPEKPASPSFAAFSTKWLEAYPSAAENRSSTIRGKEFHVRAHLAPYWKETPIDEIGAMAIAHMIGDLKKKKKRVRDVASNAKRVGPNGSGAFRDGEKTISSQTVKNITQTLHKILTSAHEWGLLSEVPKFPKRKNLSSSFDYYTAEESALLLAATGTKRKHREKHSIAAEDLALLTFALRTGARAGEQLAVTWGDIDWVGRKVHFRRQYHKGEFRELKAGPSRAVDLSPVLIEVLKRWRSEQVRGLDVARGFSGSIGGADLGTRDLVFPLRSDGFSAETPRELWHLRDVLRRYSRRAGLRRIKWHELRHSFASQAVTAGVQLQQVQGWLGHRTIHMTMRYAHLAPTNGAAYIALLDQAPSGADAREKEEAQ